MRSLKRPQCPRRHRHDELHDGLACNARNAASSFGVRARRARRRRSAGRSGRAPGPASQGAWLKGIGRMSFSRCCAHERFGQGMVVARVMSAPRRARTRLERPSRSPPRGCAGPRWDRGHLLASAHAAATAREERPGGRRPRRRVRRLRRVEILRRSARDALVVELPECVACSSRRVARQAVPVDCGRRAALARGPSRMVRGFAARPGQACANTAAIRLAAAAPHASYTDGPGGPVARHVRRFELASGTRYSAPSVGQRRGERAVQLPRPCAEVPAEAAAAGRESGHRRQRGGEDEPRAETLAKQCVQPGLQVEEPRDRVAVTSFRQRGHHGVRREGREVVEVADRRFVVAPVRAMSRHSTRKRREASRRSGP